jgi:hypothetical protein
MLNQLHPDKGNEVSEMQEKNKSIGAGTPIETWLSDV